MNFLDKMAKKTQPAEKLKQELARKPHKSQGAQCMSVYITTVSHALTLPSLHQSKSHHLLLLPLPLKMDHDGQAKLEQEEMDQSEQEKANKTEEDNNAAAEMAIINGQNDNINNDPGRDGDFNCEDLWELEDINQMETAAAAAEFYDVRGGGWGEWKHDAGGETWREWQFYPANNNYEENDWVIDDLWVFEDHHHQPNNNKANYNLDSASATNPRDPKA